MISDSEGFQVVFEGCVVNAEHERHCFLYLNLFSLSHTFLCILLCNKVVVHTALINSREKKKNTLK